MRTTIVLARYSLARGDGKYAVYSRFEYEGGFYTHGYPLSMN